MEDKILIKGKFQKLNIFGIVMLAIAGFTLVLCTILATIIYGSPIYLITYIQYGWFAMWICVIIFIVIGIRLLSFKDELTITENRVIGKTIMGKRVELPISQVSAVATGMFKSVTVASSSGNISFFGVLNSEEIVSCINKKLMERQENSRNNFVTVAPTAPSVAQELGDLKKLLDQGIITQEEFDAKK